MSYIKKALAILTEAKSNPNEPTSAEMMDFEDDLDFDVKDKQLLRKALTLKKMSGYTEKAVILWLKAGEIPKEALAELNPAKTPKKQKAEYGDEGYVAKRENLGGFKDTQFENNFLKYYKVDTVNLRKEVGDAPDFGIKNDEGKDKTWEELDYDVDVNYPKSVKRKNGKAFDEHDVNNIKNYEKYCRSYKGLNGGIKLQLWAGVGEKKAHGEMEFH